MFRKLHFISRLLCQLALIYDVCLPDVSFGPLVLLSGTAAITGAAEIKQPAEIESSSLPWLPLALRTASTHPCFTSILASNSPPL
jgi:hypothetical protein